MASRRKAEPGDVRARQLSRRFVLSGGSSAPFITDSEVFGRSDPAVARCARWLAIDAEQRHLQLEWGTLEGVMMTKHNWYKRSPEEQATIREGARLDEIDARLKVLETEGRALLKAMRLKPAKSVEAVIANLSVAARLIFVEDQPEAHGLITRAVRDLVAFSCSKRDVT